MIIDVQIKNLDKLTKGLDEKKQKGLGAIGRAVKIAGLHLLAYVKENKLSGQVLKVRTGNLRRSITATFESSGTQFKSTVGTNAKYARLHEYGFSGTLNVGAHDRKIKKAFGRQLKSPRVINVRAHSRNVNMKPRPFMKPSLDENRTLIKDNIRKALIEALA